MSAERIEPPNPHGRFRYGSWRGGPDPLAPPYDVRAAVDKIGADLLSAGNLRDSLRELLRRGTRRPRRAGPAGRADRAGCGRRPGGAATSAAPWTRSGPRWTRRWPPSGRPWPAPRATTPGSPRWSWTPCPDDVAGAVRALEPYQWRSDEARATYQSILDMLRREVLDAQFAGMKQALESPDPEAMQRVKDMLADLNALLAAHARNEDTTDAFADFMAKHGEFFPEQPENVEELIDALARRQAAAQRMLASLSPEQREQLGQLMSQALGDADLAAQMAQLSDNLRSLRPGLDRESPSGMRPGRRVAGLQRRGAGGGRAGRPGGAAGPARPERRRRRPWTTSTSTCWSSGSAPRRSGTSGRCGTWSASWSSRATSAAATTGCGSPRGPYAGSARPRCAGSSPSWPRPATATTTTGGPGRPTSRPD